MEWLERVKKNIFPLSREQQNIKVALAEWQYQGEMFDLEEAYETCQLCGHENIRYQFEIANKATGNTLLIGSECITKFGGVRVLDEHGNALPILQAKKKVSRDKRKIIADTQTRSVFNSLIELGRLDTDFNIASFEKDYKERGAFTPKQLFLIIWRLEKFRIPHNKTYFRATIKRPVYKHDLLNMDIGHIQKIWPCLSASQKALVRVKYKQVRPQKS